MKFLILVLCCAIGARALDQELINEKLEKIIEFGIECAESENVPAEDLEVLKKHQPPVTHEGKCLVFCVAKKMNFMNEDGTLNKPDSDWLHRVKANDPEIFDKMSTIFETCSGTVKPVGEGCEDSFKYISCFKEESIKVNLGNLFTVD